MKLETLQSLVKLKNLKIFQGIHPNIVEYITRNSEREEFRPWDIIIEQGESSNGKGYIIEAGSVNVYVNKKQTTRLEAGEMFGEIALLNEEERSATVIAETQTTTIILSQEILFKMIEHDDNSINKEIIRRIEENVGDE